MHKIAMAAGVTALCAVLSVAAADDILKRAEAAEKANDLSGAEKLFQQAAAQGSVEAEHQLGELYNTRAAIDSLAANYSTNGDDGKTKSDLDLAVTWLGKAAEHGNTQAQASLASIYESPVDGMQDPAKAFQWRLAAAKGGDPDSQYEAGRSLEHGEGVDADLDAAIGWYRKSAAQGDGFAQDALLRLTPPGDDPVKQALHDGLVADDKSDHAAAIQAYRRAAALGSAEGQERLGDALLNDISGKVIYAQLNGQEYTPSATECKEMLDTLQKSVGRYDAGAMYNLGIVYRDGYCTAQNKPKAIEWLKKAAKLGNKDAQDVLKSKAGL